MARTCSCTAGGLHGPGRSVAAVPRACPVSLEEIAPAEMAAAFGVVLMTKKRCIYCGGELQICPRCELPCRCELCNLCYEVEVEED